MRNNPHAHEILPDHRSDEELKAECRRFLANVTLVGNGGEVSDNEEKSQAPKPFDEQGIVEGVNYILDRVHEANNRNNN